MISGVRVRCRNCETRRTLNHHPDWYIRTPKCAVCGNNTYTVDGYRMKKGANENYPTCYCDGAHYPHRIASVLLCKFRDMTEEDERKIEALFREAGTDEIIVELDYSDMPTSF
jgi:hypothetical protein